MNRQAVYTRGSIAGAMMKTAVAMVAGTFAMSGYNLADTYFVGQLGRSPLAAMGFSFPVIMLIGCVFHGMGAGVMATAAQALGGGKQVRAAGLVSAGVLLIALVSVVLAVLGIATSDAIFTRIGAEGRTLDEVCGYMNIWYFGCVTAALSMAGNNILISAGDSKSASIMMIVGMLINAGLDPLLIYGWWIIPGMGIRGAALATIVSQAIATAALLTLLVKKHRLLKFAWIPWRQLLPEWRRIIHYAVPASIGMLMMPIGSLVLTRITAHFGDAAVAAVAASGRLEMVAFIFPMALGIGLMPMVGQNFGARLYSRIREGWKFAMGFAFFYLLAAAVIYTVFAEWMVTWFSPDPEIRRIMVICMRIIPWGFGMIEIHRYSGFFFTGCGRPAVAAWLNALRIVGLMIPFSLLALYFESVPGLFWARLAADVLAGGTGLWLSRRLTLKLPQTDGAPPPPVHGVIRHLLSGRLRSAAVAQADIDNRSSTQ